MHNYNINNNLQISHNKITPDKCCAVATVVDNSVDDASTTMKPGFLDTAKDFTKKVEDKVSETTGIPSWGVVAIFAVIILLILGICGFCIRRFFKKRRTKDGKKGKGVDLKSVQLLGSAYKEKVSKLVTQLV